MTDNCYLCKKELGTFSIANEYREFHPAPDGMTEDDVLCSDCARDFKKKVYQGNSLLWYLCPIFLGIVGGVLMFVALRKENESMAQKGLLLSIILTALGIAITVVTSLRPDLWM